MKGGGQTLRQSGGGMVIRGGSIRRVENSVAHSGVIPVLGFLGLSWSFFGFRPRKKNLEQGLVSFGTFFVNKVLV